MKLPITVRRAPVEAHLAAELALRQPSSGLAERGLDVLPVGGARVEVRDPNVDAVEGRPRSLDREDLGSAVLPAPPRLGALFLPLLLVVPRGVGALRAGGPLSATVLP